MERFWNLFRKSKTSQELPKQTVSPTVCFDSNYTSVIAMDYVHGYYDILDWVNQNSAGSVDVKFENSYGQEKIYIAFEREQDALLFKIRFSEDLNVR